MVLSWAQQLKNKDIPEGGSKAVCLVTPTAGLERDQLMHGCVKVRLRAGVGFRVRASPNPSPNPNPNQAFTDGLLDLITPAALKKLAPRGTPEEELPNELLYLGPDENITPTDINWVRPRRAPRAPRPTPRAPRPVHCALRTLPRSRRAPGNCSPVHMPGPATLRRACYPSLQPEALTRAGGRSRGAARLCAALLVHVVQARRGHQPQGVRRPLRGRGRLPARG